MWTRTHSTTVKGLDIEKPEGLERRRPLHEWQPAREFAKLDGPFATGSTSTLRPKGGPTVRIELLTVEPGRRFTDLTRFPLGRMYGDHVFVVRGDEIEIQTTMRVEGPLRAPGCAVEGPVLGEGEAHLLARADRGLHRIDEGGVSRARRQAPFTEDAPTTARASFSGR
jgi:hypothetical protein